jgi:hypothetical protein
MLGSKTYCFVDRFRSRKDRQLLEFATRVSLLYTESQFGKLVAIADVTETCKGHGFRVTSLEPG